MEYLRWAKIHPKVRYELTDSSVPPVGRRDFDTDTVARAIEFEARGAYGHPELIHAVAERYGADPDGVVPAPGASSANFIALAAALKHGDTVLVEHPVYDPIERVATFLGLRVIPILRRPSLSFDVPMQEIEAGLRQGARAVALTNLHNPSGRLLPIDTIRGIAAQCADAGVTLVVDEVYLDSAALILERPVWTAAQAGANVITSNSLTKVYGLGGLRIGWLLASPALAERARRIMDLLSVVNAAPSTSLAIQAFSGMSRLEDRFRAFHRQGQRVFRGWLAGQSLLAGYANHGAIFECLRLPEGVGAVRLNEVLVTEYDTQVVPGRFFGLDDHIRISLTLPPADLAEALSRISDAVGRLVSKG